MSRLKVIIVISKTKFLDLGVSLKPISSSLAHLQQGSMHLTFVSTLNLFSGLSRRRPPLEWGHPRPLESPVHLLPEVIEASGLVEGVL